MEQDSDGHSLNISRGIADNNLSITGSIRSDSESVKLKIAIHQPEEYARQVFYEKLQSAGITIKGNDFKCQIQERQKLAEYLSPPLEEIIRTINKKSQNLAAELIFQEANLYGNECDRQGPLSHLVRELKIKDKNFAIYGGSGLSRHNCLTPCDVCSLLKYLHASESIIIDSLPIAGVDGTLRERFKGTFGEGNIKAKTGSMSGVSSLAGYATTKRGREICFCVFVNHFTQESSICRNVIDELLLKVLEQN